MGDGNSKRARRRAYGKIKEQWWRGSHIRAFQTVEDVMKRDAMLRNSWGQDWWTENRAPPYMKLDLIGSLYHSPLGKPSSSYQLHVGDETIPVTDVKLPGVPNGR